MTVEKSYLDFLEGKIMTINNGIMKFDRNQLLSTTRNFLMEERDHVG